MTHLALIAALLLCTSCHGIQHQDHDDPVKIIFDTDMGSDCDDVGALALLHAYADMDKVRIIACVYSSGKVPYGAGIIQAINIYYGRGNIPIGAYHGDDLGDPVDKMNAKTLAKDTTRFGNTIVHNRDAEEMTRMNRRLLVSQRDNSVIYLTVGHTKGLYDLLGSEPDAVSPRNGMDLIKQKVKRWIALGALGAINEKGTHQRDWNFCFNETAPYTDYLLGHFPRPMFFITAGDDVMTGKSLKQSPPDSIVRVAYTEWLRNYSQKTLDDQRPSWDLAAVYYAVEGPGDYLTQAENGVLDFDVERGCLWIESEEETGQTLVRQRKNVNQTFAQYLNHMIALPPRLTNVD